MNLSKSSFCLVFQILGCIINPSILGHSQIRNQSNPKPLHPNLFSFPLPSSPPVPSTYFCNILDNSVFLLFSLRKYSIPFFRERDRAGPSPRKVRIVCPYHTGPVHTRTGNLDPGKFPR